MPEVLELKASLLQTAAELAVATLENASPVGPDGTPIPVICDPTDKDNGLRIKTLAVYEKMKDFYVVLVNALADQSGIFPDPKVPTVVKPTPVTTIPSNAGPGVNIPSPGHDLIGVVNQVAGAVSAVATGISPVVPGAAPVGVVAGAVANATK